jgi:UDP-N-acetylglucosamine diphosphorylase/glucosamine-1-phosphate N-acetyltransferase
MKLIIYEDGRYDSLYPLTYMRPVFELRCGATALAEKVRHAAGAPPTAYFVRDWLRESYAEKTDAPVNDMGSLEGDVMLVNGRLLADGKCDLGALGPDEALKTDGTLIAANVRAATLAAARADSFEATLAALEPRLTTRRGAATMIDYPWSLIYHNAAMIKSDFKRLYKPGVHAPMHPLSCIIGDPGSVYVAPTAQIHPLVVIDVTGGPVIIDENVLVLPHTRIDGPSCIGPECRIMGGKIREACSFGPVCRVAGEVECTIMQGYTNKQHDGFLGHSYVCEWVNLGALTTNSDLKNDYGAVDVILDGKKPVSTGSVKVGALIGDHTKTSIGTLLNTGAYVGGMSLIMATGKPLPKYIPEFCWLLEGAVTKGFGKGKLYETAQAAMSRRKMLWTEADLAMWDAIFQLTAPQRDEAVRRARRAFLHR